MSEIKRLTANQINEYVRIVGDAYPGYKIASEEDRRRTSERLQKRLKEDPTVAFYGLFRGGKLLGGMRLHDFTMTYVSQEVPVGGVGLVAVDLAHKKERVAKDLMTFFLEHYRKRGASLAVLYPFRPDFYKRMGFGYGTKINQYRVKPAHLPRGESKKHVRLLGKEDQEALLACSRRVMERTHGMFTKTEFEARMMLEAPSLRVVGCVKDGKVPGYLAFLFKPGKQVLQNPMEIVEWVYETPEALSELMTFLSSQADQVHEIIYNTQDENFHFLPLDPRNGTENLITSDSHETNTSGIGLMYRALHVPGLFKTLGEHSFGGQTCKLKVTLRDSFLKGNTGSTTVHFIQGKPAVRPRGDHEVEIRMDVAEFSSLLMGVIPFKRLLNYGLAEISKPRYADTVNRLFLTETKPICLTDF